MRASVAQLDGARAGVVQQLPRGCAVHKRLVFCQGLVTRSYLVKPHKHRAHNGCWWISEASGLLLQCCQAQAFLWTDQ